MTKLQIAKKILARLNRVERCCDAIAAANHARAITSFNNHEENNTLLVMERIIDKTYLIQQLHNMYVKAVHKIEVAPKEFKSVLKHHFMGGVAIPKLAEQSGESERGLYRLADRALEWFAHNLEDIEGYEKILAQI